MVNILGVLLGKLSVCILIFLLAYLVLLGVLTRDGHTDAADAEVCGLMRIWECDADDKICMRIVGKKKVKNRTKLAQNGSKYDKNI